MAKKRTISRAAAEMGVATTQQFNTLRDEWPAKDRVGVYLASVSSDSEFYRYWDGFNFHYGAKTVEEAYTVRGVRWNHGSYLFWRGLADYPSKVKP